MIKFPPKQGSFLQCDFRGFIEPEMTKKRPVIVISTPTLHGEGNKLATIVPLSTTHPDPVKEYHYLLKNIPILPYYVKNHKIDPLAINSPILQFQPNL